MSKAPVLKRAMMLDANRGREGPFSQSLTNRSSARNHSNLSHSDWSERTGAGHRTTTNVPKTQVRCPQTALGTVGPALQIGPSGRCRRPHASSCGAPGSGRPRPRHAASCSTEMREGHPVWQHLHRREQDVPHRNTSIPTGPCAATCSRGGGAAGPGFDGCHHRHDAQGAVGSLVPRSRLLPNRVQWSQEARAGQSGLLQDGGRSAEGGTLNRKGVLGCGGFVKSSQPWY